jgi:Holliday junction resolvasome RuvABC ATP-dependent DNA helicase subunit
MSTSARKVPTKRLQRVKRNIGDASDQNHVLLKETISLMRREEIANFGISKTDRRMKDVFARSAACEIVGIKEFAEAVQCEEAA